MRRSSCTSCIPASAIVWLFLPAISCPSNITEPGYPRPQPRPGLCIDRVHCVIIESPASPSRAFYWWEEAMFAWFVPPIVIPAAIAAYFVALVLYRHFVGA